MKIKDYKDYLKLEARLITQNPKEWFKWYKLQRAFVKEHPYCEMCGWDKKLNVHHIKPRHLFPELSLEWFNLITLCRECHFRFGHFLNWGDYNKNIVEMVNARHYWNSYMIGREDQIKCPFCGGGLYKKDNLIICENEHKYNGGILN